MPTMRSLTVALLTSAALLSAGGCATSSGGAQQFPLTSDLSVAPEPIPPADLLISDEAANEYDNAVQAWGREGWERVGRICRWARDAGLDVACPKPPDPG